MTEIHSTAQLELVQRWLAGVAYKPGVTFEASAEEWTGVIRVYIDALLFDSTRPGATKVVRNRSVRVSLPPSRQSMEVLADWEILEVASYDLGPDLVGGPLVRVGKSVTVPPYLRLKATLEDHGAFLAWLRTELHDLERHESDEWLRDAETGKAFFDPHSP